MLFLGLSWGLLYLGVALLVALTFHEAAHAWAADRLGDPTARLQGRLTLNPLAHLHPLGTLLLLLVGLGWGRPVPIDARRLRPSPQVGMGLVAIAGPISNLLLALPLGLLLRTREVKFYPTLLFDTVPFSWGLLLSWVVWLNLALAVFNLIPIAPLDGSRLVMAVLPRRYFYWIARIEPYSMLLLVAAILWMRFSGEDLLARVLLRPIGALWWGLVDLTPPFPI